MIERRNKAIRVVAIIVVISAFVFLLPNTGYVVTMKSVEVSENKAIVIANANPEVNAYIAGNQYTVAAGNVTAEDRARLPSVYNGLDSALYKVTYSMKDMDLLVITDNEKVLKIVSIKKIKVS